MALVFLLISIAANVGTNALFKQATALDTYSFHKIALLAGGLLFGAVTALCYARSLEKLDLGLAYSVFSGASIILITLMAVVFFKDPLPVGKIVGMAVIIAGIVVVSRS